MVQGEPTDIFSLPKGTKTGTLLHDILEHLDFAEKDASVKEKLVADKLMEHGFDPIWQESIRQMIRKVLVIPLDPKVGDFQLSYIRNEDRLNELAFYFPLKSISPKSLKSLFSRYASPEFPGDFPVRIERLDFTPVRGFMKGFIDLVFQFKSRFYLVDWKSNFLGSRIEDYGQEALSATMVEDYYVLQYHIYAVALNQYLYLRLPGYDYDTHFGGVYYIFLRGVDPDSGPEYGIYRDRPSADLIKELSATLIDSPRTPLRN
jgi:exodeoxyribonuclease V beta subunit